MSLTCAERQNIVVGYMTRLGYVFCAECEPRPDPAWEPMQIFNLISSDDECDGCHARLAIP